MNLDFEMNVKNELKKTIETGDTDGFVTKLNDSVQKTIADSVEKEVLAKFREMGNETDERVLASRGISVLTNEEKTFYENLKKMQEVKGELTDVEVTLPITTENKIYEDMFNKHELLRAIDFVDSKGITQWVVSKDLDYAYSWGNLNDAVTAEASAAFAVVEFSNFKLSVWIPVPKTMLDLGLVWIDQFVVRYLSEIIARALETAIVSGNGQKQPVGMIKEVNVASQTVPATDKTATAITDLSPKTIGTIAAALTNDGKRDVGVIDMIVNPVDYWSLVYPALNVMNMNGSVTQVNLPIRVIQSNAVTKGKAIFGICRNYFATVGFGVPNGKIEYSDHFKFLDDVRTYKARCVAYGTPKDNVSFLYYDISGLEEAAIPVKSKGASAGAGA